MPPKPAPTNLTPTQISKPHFLAALRRYPGLVPAALKPLDRIRYHDIPSALSSSSSSSSPSSPSPSLTLPQLEQLAEWKLKHGTYRPRLLALVRSNAPSAVEDASAEAFGILLSAAKGEEEEEEGKGKGKGKAKGKEIEALKVLTKALKGVGPATASLVLACREPASTPFFSDEVYRWMLWGDEEAKGKGKGWGRRIGYTEKEYGVLVGKVREVVGRMRGWGLGEEELGEAGEAVAVEKVAWVLGKEGVDCDRVVGEGEEEEMLDKQVEGKGRKREADMEGETVEVEKVEKGTTQKETANKSKKRKVQQAVEVDSRRQTRSSARKV